MCLYVPERITGRCLRLASLASLSLSSGVSLTLASRSFSFILRRFSPLPRLSMAKVQHAGRNVIMLWLFRPEKIRRFVHSPENRTVRPFTGKSDGPSIHRKIGRSVHSPEDRTVHSPKLTDIGSLRSPQLLKLQIKSEVFTILLNIIQCVIPMHQYCLLYGTTTPS